MKTPYPRSVNNGTTQEIEILDKFNATHDCFACIDRNPMGTNQVIMAQHDKYMVRKLEDKLTESILYKMYEELTSNKFDESFKE